MLKNEWKKLFQSKFMIAVMVAIILIPTIYTAIFVGAMWDPYGRLERLPVAVVNKDQPVMYNEKELNVGEDLVKNMKEDNSLGFHFVDEKTAESGLANGTYYMVITIPEDFSQNATTLMEDDTKKMELYYTTNPGENYIASKMSETAVSKIQQSIREKITTQYTETVFEQLETIGDGFVEAADGALQITDGTDQLLAGNQKMNDGLNALSEGTSILQQGSATLEEGIGAYTEGVADLENGAALLNEKGSSLKIGVDSVSNGLISLKSGSGAILAGMNQMSDTLASSMTPEKEAQIQQLQTGLTGVNNAIVQANQLMQVINTKQGLGQDISTEMAQLTALLSGLQTNAGVVLPGSQQAITELQGGLQNVQNVLDRNGTTPETMGLIQAMTTVDDGIGQLEAGVNGENGLKNGIYAYTDGTASVAAGAEKLTANSKALTEGAGKISNGADSLQKGVAQLTEGSDSLGKGLEELKNGSMTLADSLTEAGDEVNSTKTDEDTVDMFAAPVESIGDTYSHIENNGSAMAAYMMGVGLWVACIAFCTIYPLTKPAGEVKKGVSWWFSKATVYLVISVVQAVVMIFMLKWILGFEPQYLGKTILVAVVASMAFMSVMYFFNVCFGKVGSYLMLIFMVLQLGGSAGTYPLELSSDFYHMIHEHMPFTYSVKAFRATISTGNEIMPQMRVFIGMIVVFNLLSLAVFLYKSRKGETQFKAELIGE